MEYKYTEARISQVNQYEIQLFTTLLDWIGYF